jgi:DNA polymerase
MTTNPSATDFLKEMGITTWQTRVTTGDSPTEIAPELNVQSTLGAHEAHLNVPVTHSFGIWWFYGDQPQGEAAQLLDNVVRALGLSEQQWVWKKPASQFNRLELPSEGGPLVAITFGASATQVLTGEHDSLVELRGSILMIPQEGAEDIPVIATFDLFHLLSKPKDKMLFWQDLLLAKSVLHSL